MRRFYRLMPALLCLSLLLSGCGASSGAPAKPGPSGMPTAAAAPTSSAGSMRPMPSNPSAAQPTISAGAAGETEGGVAPGLSLRGDGAEPAQGVEVLPPPNTVQQQVGLRAGEVDDNADFSAYLDYLANYSGPRAPSVDVSDRAIVTVVNGNQQPVLDARVQAFDGTTLVFEGRTYAGGQTILFPRTFSQLSSSGSLRVVAEKSGERAEGTLAIGQGGTQSVSLVLSNVAAVPAEPRLDVVFLLDATGSMGDEIGQLQQSIISIAEQVDQLSPQPSLRLALVAYRDRGDEYVTRGYDFTEDVDAFRATLITIDANGGGDNPESLNEGLHEAIASVSWRDDAIRLIILVADAPPHLDYEQDFDYVNEIRTAVAGGIKIFPIAASNTDEQAEYIFRQLAQQTMGSFMFLTYQLGQNAGPAGDTTVHSVDPQQFTVEDLDDLVVKVIQRELARSVGQ